MSDTDEDIALVLPLFKGDPPEPRIDTDALDDMVVTSANVYALKCRPYCHAIVDFTARTIECSKCGRTLDAFDVINAIIKEWGRVRHGLKEYERARKRLADLLVEERRAKGRVRYLRSKIEEMSKVKP